MPWSTFLNSLTIWVVGTISSLKERMKRLVSRFGALVRLISSGFVAGISGTWKLAWLRQSCRWCSWMCSRELILWFLICILDVSQDKLRPLHPMTYRTRKCPFWGLAISSIQWHTWWWLRHLFGVLLRLEVHRCRSNRDMRQGWLLSWFFCWFLWWGGFWIRYLEVK